MYIISSWVANPMWIFFLRANPMNLDKSKRLIIWDGGSRLYIFCEVYMEKCVPIGWCFPLRSSVPRKKKMFSFVEKNMKLFHTGPRRRSKTGEVFPVPLLFDDVFCSIVLTHRHLIVWHSCRGVVILPPKVKWYIIDDTIQGTWVGLGQWFCSKLLAYWWFKQQ